MKCGEGSGTRGCNTRRDGARCGPRSQGITLIELLVVLAILGIVSTVAAPAMLKTIDKFALNSTGRRLAAAFRTAQVEAKLGQREVLGTLAGRAFIFARQDKQVARLELPTNLEVSSETDVVYSFLTSGLILGPGRLELVSNGRYRGWIILGPRPGSVRFEEE